MGIRSLTIFLATLLAFHAVVQIAALGLFRSLRGLWWTWSVVALTMVFSVTVPFVFGQAGNGNDGLILVIGLLAAATGIVPASILSVAMKLRCRSR